MGHYNVEIWRATMADRFESLLLLLVRNPRLPVSTRLITETIDLTASRCVSPVYGLVKLLANFTPTGRIRRE